MFSSEKKKLMLVYIQYWQNNITATNLFILSVFKSKSGGKKRIHIWKCHKRACNDYNTMPFILYIFIKLNNNKILQFQKTWLSHAKPSYLLPPLSLPSKVLPISFTSNSLLRVFYITSIPSPPHIIHLLCLLFLFLFNLLCKFQWRDISNYTNNTCNANVRHSASHSKSWQHFHFSKTLFHMQWVVSGDSIHIWHYQQSVG